jgi:hypothetical protein
MNRPEQALHRAVAQFLDAALLPPALWFHIPNGGGRSRVEAAILAGLGVKAGVPDICIVHAGQVYFLELKSARGRLSDAQRAMLHSLTRSGARVGIAYSLDQVIGRLQGWDLPMRLSDLRRAQEPPLPHDDPGDSGP